MIDHNLKNFNIRCRGDVKRNMIKTYQGKKLVERS